jgi:uncharacterized protein
LHGIGRAVILGLMADPALPSSSASTLDALPLFPLQLVLYPGGLLPLRIFEVRYLDMIGRAHRDGTPFGVVSLIEGQDVQQPARAPPGLPTGDAFANERFHAVGTLATISQLERPQPGLMVIRCTGTQRFRLSSQQRLSHGLWTGQAHTLPVDVAVPVPPDLAATRDALRALIQQFQAQLEPDHELPLQAPFLWDDCGWVAHRWCELLPMATAMKQRLLETDSPLLRLELVSDLLEQLRAAPR